MRHPYVCIILQCLVIVVKCTYVYTFFTDDFQTVLWLLAILSKSKKSLRETREYSCLLVSTDVEAARAGTDGYTDTQDNYMRAEG